MGSGRDALWESGHDESVEVNQRALIDKVLARYSGEFTVFRELLQNSDDARSRSVEIHFETKEHIDRKKGKQSAEETNEGEVLPDLKTTLVHQWTFRNNGIIFRDEDWSRLKKIAEGNPDEEKIGAFGVGFYSLFSVTDEPFVTSGGQWMGFYWKDKKDQLFARRGELPNFNAAVPDQWTSFEMALREPVPIPGAFDFTRFLASSITFMAYLSEVSVYFDNKRLARLTKSPGIPKTLELPAGFKYASSMGVMNVTGIKTTPLHIKAEVMQCVYSAGTEKPPPPPPVLKSLKLNGGFFSSLFSARSSTPQRDVVSLPIYQADPVDPLTINETSVALSIFSADVNVNLEKKIATELHRSTKKNPPRKLKYELIYTAKDEYDSSVKEDENLSFATGSVFQGLRADLEGAGSTRIFIGHATGQTTGLGGHMSTRFIPTVERESIDLVDRNVAIWNRELLYVGGFLARTAYESELKAIRGYWAGASTPGAPPELDVEAWLRRRSLHALKFFSFHPSTPSSEISTLLESAFFACQTEPSFPIISSVGIRNAVNVRYPDPTFSEFLKDLPILSEEVVKGAPRMVAALQQRGMVKPITFADVLKELQSRPLEEDQMLACLRWWISLSKQGDNQNLSQIRTELLNAAVLTTGTGTANEKLLALSSIKSFINAKNTMGASIPTDGPLPDHVIPLSVTKSLPPEDLVSCFPWTELSIVDWLKHLIAPAMTNADPSYDLSLSATWAERVLGVLTRSWPSLSNGMKDHIASLLKDVTCIPTSAGLKTPQQSYFSNANIFPDLPIVTMPSEQKVKGPLEKVLATLGVRKHVDLQVVFNRMFKTGDWTIAELTKYLVAVRSTLTEEEIGRLRNTTAFTSENSKGSDSQKPVRYRAQDLYEPLDIFRQLQLPVIDWGANHKWRGFSEEAKFMFELGLQRYPPLETIINLCASSDATIRPIALKYLLDNMSIRYPKYDPMDFAEVAFIPTATRMGTPKEVFLNPEWAELGFLVVQPGLHQDARWKLKIREHPPAPLLVDLLRRTPPSNDTQAKQWFGILAGRISDFSVLEFEQLSQLPMVPVSDTSKVKGSLSIRWMPPNRCYFGSDSRARFHSKLFVFIDFGHLANSFLSSCGTKREPSVEEIAEILLADPRKFYELADGCDNFLDELRNIAVNYRAISSATMKRMKTAPILLGMQRKLRSETTSKHQQSNSIEDDDDWVMQYDLKKPGQVIIADDTNAYQVFGDSIFTAPQEDILEAFYAQLGSPRLGSLLKEEYKTSAEIKGSGLDTEIRRLILERLPLFLHEHNHTKTRVTFGWLNTGNNLVVKTFSKVTVSKSLNYGDVRLSRTLDVSAAAKRLHFGPIQLWLAGNVELDMYEIATALCRILFEAPKANDALLFMTILSTDLRSLKRRGYNVDRILRQQKAERQAAEYAAKQRAENTALIPQTTSAPPLPTLPPPTTIPASAFAPPAPPAYAEQDPSNPRSHSAFLQNWKRRLGSTMHFHHHQSEEGTGSRPPLSDFTRFGERPRNRNVTPLSDIASNIDMAIRACTPETRHLVHNREEMSRIRESLNEGYCDISGRTGDLTLIASTGDVKVYASKDVPDPMSILTMKNDSLERFIHLMHTLAEIFGLSLISLHVFFDTSGELIAFNRNGSIFLNLRYFEAWHDEEVRNGNVMPALISWYFTLAHEIAHNLVQPHNSEHEFYFSAICEKYLANLWARITPPKN